MMAAVNNNAVQVNLVGAGAGVPYILVDDNVVIADGITEEDSVSQILHWIGFTIDAQREAIQDDAIAKFDDIKVLTEKDVTQLATDFASRTAANGRMSIGARRSKRLKALLHWVQDFYRVSEEPSIVGLTKSTFLADLDAALSRAEVRQTLKSNSDTSSKVADPGPLKSELEWREWEEKFTNFLGCIIGVNGIPLSYVIRDNDEPDTDGQHTNFVSKTVACAPLEGEYYLADRLTVFNLILSFTTGQPSGDWIKNTIKYNDGRRSMQALRAHFAGEGNASRNKAVADALKASLHYKNERAMPFETFLTKCQQMFNIYDKEGESMGEDAKLRFLYGSIQHQGLDSAVQALKVQRTAGIDITYTQAANHLSKAVSELPEYIAKNRNISSLKMGNNETHGSDAIYDDEGNVKTGYISGWQNLKKSDKDIVVAARKRLGIQPGKWRNKSWNKNDDKTKIAADNNRLKQLESQNKKYKVAIKALKRNRTTDDQTPEDTERVDAGDSFGGKASKKKAKS